MTIVHCVRYTALGLAMAASVSGGSLQAQDQSDNVADYLYQPHGFFPEPGVISRAAIFGERHFGNSDEGNGKYLDFAHMIPGAGWISGGPGYRKWASRDRLFFDTSAELSWYSYETAQARVELPKLLRSRLLLGLQGRYQDFTQIAFFGEGASSVESNESDYRLKSKDGVAYASVRPAEWLDIDGSVGWLEPSIVPPSGTFRHDRPSTQHVFPLDPVFTNEVPRFVHTSLGVVADVRDYPRHPTRGGLVRVGATDYEDQDQGQFSFRMYEAEAEAFVPIAGARVVLALHAWAVASDPKAGQIVPFYLQPSLGGENTLRGYSDYRFHDNNLAVVNVETRVAIFTHVDAAVFGDAGNVAPRFADLGLDKQSYGIGLRFHTRRTTFARLDMARNDDGWRWVFRLTDPFNPSRLSRRTADVPFVP